MPMLLECTHLSIMPHTTVLQATGVPDPDYVETTGLKGVSSAMEFVRVLGYDEAETTIYDGLME